MINATGLSNSVIGGPNKQLNAIRFKAAHSSPLAAFRCYIIDHAEGYSSGSGGVLRASLSDEVGGFPGHYLTGGFRTPDPEFPDPSSGKGRFPLVVFNNISLRLTKGNWYWLVIDNYDASPLMNYFSMDYLQNETIPNQVPDAQVYLRTPTTPWVLVPKLIPSPLVLFYANGLSQGLGWIGLVNGKLECGAPYGFPAGSCV